MSLSEYYALRANSKVALLLLLYYYYYHIIIIISIIIIVIIFMFQTASSPLLTVKGFSVCKVGFELVIQVLANTDVLKHPL